MGNISSSTSFPTHFHGHVNLPKPTEVAFNKKVSFEKGWENFNRASKVGSLQNQATWSWQQFVERLQTKQSESSSKVDGWRLGYAVALLIR